MIPVSDTPAILCAEYADGVTCIGQANINLNRSARGSIKKIFMQSPCTATRDALSAIRNANLIILGPGDIYTSTLANFVVSGVPEAVAASSARLVHVMNLFTTPESRKMTMMDYVTRVTRYASRSPDIVVVNSAPISETILRHYARHGQHPLLDNLTSNVVRVDILQAARVEQHVADAVVRSLVRHDPDKLARVIMAL